MTNFSAARPAIRTPDQRLRVFVSSTIGELAPERAAVKQAIGALRLAPVLFEMGARPHPPRDLYRAYLEQSDIFVGIYWQSYGWVAPEEEISGLEDEYRLSTGKPRLIYLKEPAPERQERLKTLISQIRDGDTASYQKFGSAEELGELVANDLALMLTERFAESQPAPPVAGAMAEQRPLPAVRGPLIGRERELAQIVELLQRPDAGLLTLTGPGGTGKTRLALHATAALVESFDDGVVFVPLAPIRDVALVLPTIAQAMNLQEHPTTPVLEVVKGAIGDRHLLLVLDNFEQVTDAASLLVDLLVACPRLTILATSRVSLNIRGERELPIPPLSLAANEGERSAAEILFLERVREIRPDFAPSPDDLRAIQQIVARLDGLPLAIELAAARMRLLSVPAVLERLASPLDLLTRGARDLPERQQTLRSTIAWSYGLLTPSARRVFRMLGVFRGGWSLAAAEAVCGTADPSLDVLGEIETLLDSSLIVRQPSPPVEPRYTMLETIREFAVEQLQADDELAAMQQRRADYFLRLALEAWPHYTSVERPAWVARLDHDLDNLRAVLAWGRSGPDRGDVAALELACQLAGLIAWHWYFAGRASEGLEWGRDLVDGARQAGVSDEARMWALWAFGMNAYLRARMPEAVAALAETAALAQQLGRTAEYAAAITYWGTASLYLGDPTAGERLMAAVGLWQQLGNRWGEALSYTYLAMGMMSVGLADQTRQTLGGALALSQALGDGWLEGFVLTMVSIFATTQEEYEWARQSGLDSARLLRQGGDRHSVCWPLTTSGVAGLHLGAVPDWPSLVQGLVDGRDTGQHDVCVLAIAGLARSADLGDNRDLAARLVALDGRLIEILKPYLWPVGLALSQKELGLVDLDPDVRQAAEESLSERGPEELIALAIELTTPLAA